MRNFDGRLWSDKWFFKLSQEEKLLYIYLVTSDHTNDLGIFEADLDYIKLETKLENYKELLNGALASKIYFNKEKELILVKDISKFNAGRSKDYRRSLYNKLLELEPEIRGLVLRESSYLSDLFNEFENEKIALSKEGAEEVSTQSIDSVPPSIDPLPTVSNKKEKAPLKEKEKEKERSPLILSPKEKEKEKENYPQKEKNIVLSNGNSNELPLLVGNSDAIASEVLSPPPKSKKTKRKYSEEATKLVEEFKSFRENYLKVPITHKSWHLRALSVAEKLLKKYPLSELLEALKELQSEAWSDKAPKILEMWHFEDFLPKWKASKIKFVAQDEIYKGINITEWRKWYKKTYNSDIGGDLKKWIDWWYLHNGELPTKDQLYWREEYKKLYGFYPEEENQEEVVLGEKS